MGKCLHMGTVMAFVDAINSQDLPRINQMMAEDFCFVDTYGNRENKAQMQTGWPGYFAWFPDYRIAVDDYLEGDDFAVIIGWASASYKGEESRQWAIPACWRVVVQGGQILLWQVFCDAKKQLDSMQ